MKAFNYGAGLALAAYLVLALAACSKTDNGSNNSSPAAVAATQCVMGQDGIYRNQLGQSCSPTANYACAGYTYNAQTGTYINPQNPAVQIPAAQCGGTTTIPNQGYYGGTYVSGCDQWTQMYGVQYVPVQMSGQLVCVNYQYLQQQIVYSYPQYQYSPWYNDPSYWYSYAPTAYDYGYGGGGYYGYGCANNISLGFGGGGFGAGINLCF